MVEYLGGGYKGSERRACKVARLARSRRRYRSSKDPPTGLRLCLREIAQSRVRYGYRKIRELLNREGWKVGKKRVYRLYQEEGSTGARSCGANLRRLPIGGSEESPRQPMKCGVWTSWRINGWTAAAFVP